MPRIRDVGDFLEELAPSRLAEDWDNVGLLVGDPQREVKRIMTCLTITPASAEEAVRQRADLIISHHPLPFRPLKRLTTASTPGRLLLQLITAHVAVYSPHTALDSASCGINQRLAESLGMVEIKPLVARQDDPGGLGAGRCGRLPEARPLQVVADRVKRFLSLGSVQAVGAADQTVERIAVACGAAGAFLASAIETECDLFVTGETSFHALLEAEARNITLLLLGHYASERFAIESLAQILAAHFRDVDVWSSRAETDPLHRL
ncbi:MAG: Nif3-like dinuclear metal center hexameric protein [Pirellulaceae bacterium]